MMQIMIIDGRKTKEEALEKLKNLSIFKENKKPNIECRRGADT